MLQTHLFPLLLTLIGALSLPVQAGTDICERDHQSRNSDYGNQDEESLKTVSTVVELQRLLHDPNPPRVIVLTAGPAGDLTLRDLKFSPPITIRSAVPRNPAALSGLRLSYVTGLHFEDIRFHAPVAAAADSLWRAPFQITDSQNIRIIRSSFAGRYPGGSDDFPLGKGLVVDRSQQITLAETRFRYWHRAVVVSRSNDVTIHANEVTQIRSDGLNFAQVENVTITCNDLHDFRRDLTSSDHSDMIQFWTRGTTAPSRNISITHNRLDAGDGWYTQSIFMRNEVMDHKPDREDMRYRDLHIEGNMIRNAHLHGITVGQTIGLVIRNNTLTRQSDAAVPGYSRAHSTPSIQTHPISTRVILSGNRQDVGAAPNGSVFD